MAPTPAWRLLEGRHEARLPGCRVLDAAEVDPGRSPPAPPGSTRSSCVSKSTSLKKSHVGLTFIRESDIWHQSFTERAPKLGGLVEFDRSPARVQWTPTGREHPRLSAAWRSSGGRISVMRRRAREDAAGGDGLAGRGAGQRAGTPAARQCAGRLRAEAEPEEPPPSIGTSRPRRTATSRRSASWPTRSRQGETVDYDTLIRSWPATPPKRPPLTLPTGRGCGPRPPSRDHDMPAAISSPSTRAPPPPGPSCSARELTPVAASAQQEFAQHFPASGWVEHEPEDLWQSVARRAARARWHKAGADGRATSPRIGITNQRETTLVWDRATGKPIHRAIVWQDRRTADICERAARPPGMEAIVRRRPACCSTPISPAPRSPGCSTMSPGARAAAERGRARLRHGRQLPALAPDRRQGARDRCDQRLAHHAVRHPQAAPGTTTCCTLFDVPRGHAAGGARLRRRVRHDRAELFGGAIPIRGIAGDQQAATVGQACFEPGMMKSTYGTGCFAAAQHRRRRRSPRGTAC